jgi:hypothetical protein
VLHVRNTKLIIGSVRRGRSSRMKLVGAEITCGAKRALIAVKI